MKILQVALGVGAAAGGPVRSITGLARALSLTEDCDVTFFVHDPTGVERFDLGKTHVVRGHRKAGEKIDRSGDFERLLDKLRPDIVHFHGLWSLVLHMDQCACRQRGIPYIIAPRGSLDAWSLRQKRFKKELALLLFQMRDIKNAEALHVTAKMEAEHCRRMGYRGEYVLCPNGVNLPKELPPRTAGADGRKTLLFLSRMHPKKGVMELVKAFTDIKSRKRVSDFNKWQVELVYSLNGEEEEKYEQQVRAAVQKNGVEGQFIFTGPLSDEDKWTAYRRADSFVLLTHTENFGIVIAEALYAEVPVLTTKNAPWIDLERYHAGWWINLEHREVTATLEKVMTMPDEERRRMGVAGRDLVVRKYSWPSIAQSMKSEYACVLAKVKVK